MVERLETPENLLPVQPTKKAKVKISKFSLPLIIILFWLVLFIFQHRFLSAENLIDLGRQMSIVSIVAIGETFVIISAGIDLSVGAILGLVGMIAAQMMANSMSVTLAVVVSVVGGAILGLLNGLLVYDAKITPFIATLGTMTVYGGLTLLISNGQFISNIPMSLSDFIESSVAGIPVLLLFLIVLGVISWLILDYTVFGRNVFSLGSSEEAARLSGVNVRLSIYGIYTLAGVLAGIAGFLMTARLASGVPTAGDGYELDAIAAAVIGGASLFGAQGSVLGTVLGSLIMATMQNGGDLLGVQPFWLQVATGLLLLLVVFFDMVQKRRTSA